MRHWWVNQNQTYRHEFQAGYVAHTAAQRAQSQRRRSGRKRAGDVWDNSAMESFFSSLKTERTARKVYRTRDAAKADMFDYIERFYNPKRRHSTIGYMSPVEFEMQAGLA